MSRPRIIVSLGGGLGNQLFQFAVALDLAQNTDFGLDQNLGLPKRSKDGSPELAQFTLPSNAKFEEMRRLSHFTMKSTNFMLMMGKSAFRHPKNYLSGILIFLSSAVISVYLKEPRKIVAARGLGYHELRWKYRSAFLVGYFQSYRWANNPETLEKLRKLKLNSESDVVENYRSISVEEQPLVVHIRLGDYTQIPSFGIPSDEYYRLAIEEHFKRDVHKRIWLFSNEPEKALLKIPSDYRSIVRVIDEVDGSAAKTLEVMRMGYGYVIANSTYSWWGAFLSYTKTPLVIAPSPWFKGEPSPNELIPPYWQVLPAWPREQ
jgi:hypothetical protein